MSSVRKTSSLIIALVAVIVTALFPWEERWMMLKTIIPLLCLSAYYLQTKKSLEEIGLGKPKRISRLIGYGLLLGLSVDFIEMITIRPLVNWLLSSQRDVSAFAFIKGDLLMLIVALIFTWVLAAFAEEFIWRGFVLNTFASLFCGTRMGLISAWLVSSLIFGLLHWYQGLSGVIQTTFGSLILGGIYILYDRKNLWLPIMIHGVGNSISFFLIYFDVYHFRDFTF